MERPLQHAFLASVLTHSSINKLEIKQTKKNNNININFTHLSHPYEFIMDSYGSYAVCMVLLLYLMVISSTMVLPILPILLAVALL